MHALNSGTTETSRTIEGLRPNGPNTCVAMKLQANQLAPRHNAVCATCRAISSQIPTNAPASCDSAAAMRRCRRHNSALCCAASPTDGADTLRLSVPACVSSRCTAAHELLPALTVLLYCSSCHSSLCCRQRSSKPRMEPPAAVRVADIGCGASDGATAAGFFAPPDPDVVRCIAASASVRRWAQFICATASGIASAAGSRLSAAAAMPW